MQCLRPTITKKLKRQGDFFFYFVWRVFCFSLGHPRRSTVDGRLGEARERDVHYSPTARARIYAIRAVRRTRTQKYGCICGIQRRAEGCRVDGRSTTKNQSSNTPNTRACGAGRSYVAEERPQVALGTRHGPAASVADRRRPSLASSWRHSPSHRLNCKPLRIYTKHVHKWMEDY